MLCSCFPNLLATLSANELVLPPLACSDTTVLVILPMSDRQHTKDKHDRRVTKANAVAEIVVIEEASSLYPRVPVPVLLLSPRTLSTALPSLSFTCW
jgi:hypothetical protein